MSNIDISKTVAQLNQGDQKDQREQAGHQVTKTQVHQKNRVLQCCDIKIRFRDAGAELEVLHGIDLNVHSGEFVSIVGNSGSGKSTLLHILAGLEQASEGEVYIVGQPVSGLNKTQRALLRQAHLGFVYQLHHLLPEFSAVENVAMPLMLGGLSIQHASEKALYWLDRVGVAHRKNHRPNALSGGERQRVAIARALVTDPQCVLADEPTGNLDSNTAGYIHALIQELNESGTSFVIVTHDIQFASMAGVCYEMHDGVLQYCSLDKI